MTPTDWSRRWRALGLLLALPAAALAADAELVRQATLRAAPQLDAKSISELPADTKVSEVAKQGGWIQVRTSDGKSGWLRLLEVRYLSASSGGGVLSGLSTLGNVARTGSTGATSTTGAKGLEVADLQRAQPDPQEVARLDAHRSSAEQAAARAQQVKLKAQQIAEIGR